MAESPGELVILSGSERLVVLVTTITRVEPTDTLKTLGILTSPSGQTSSQLLVAKIKGIITDIVNAIQNIPLTLDEADMMIPVYYHTISTTQVVLYPLCGGDHLRCTSSLPAVKVSIGPTFFQFSN